MLPPQTAGSCFADVHAVVIGGGAKAPSHAPVPDQLLCEADPGAGGLPAVGLQTGNKSRSSSSC